MTASEYILYSMITKTTMIWIACIVFLVVITTKAMAHDTIADKVNTWATNEKEKTIAYQKESNALCTPIVIKLVALLFHPVVL